MKFLPVTIAAILLSFSLALASETAPTKPSKADKCPVCGMFVAKYPDFIARISFQDGSYAFFDGVKDLFKYYLDLKKYNPSKNLSDIASIDVTDYYSMTLCDGRKAWYVVGSNVFGPMGKELIPFEKEEDADEFKVDHVGEKIVRFGEVTSELIKGMD
ncbi:MAG TPA: nitrous oxide reductase accessory protein NosL [Syntrophobacteraceae bacterium]|nr:nitrous oxide reductase accessory protein NosL [Syntrophobacteraceae bacterium]